MQYLKEEIKNKIIAAALKEFNEKGFSGASMRAIANNAGVAIGNVYRYFENKDELFNQIMEPAFKEFTALIFDERYAYDLSGNLQSIAEDIVDKIMEVYRRCGTELLILLDKSSGSKFQNIKEDLIILIDKRIKKEILPQLLDKGIRIEDDFIFYVAATTVVEGIFTILKKYTDEAGIKRIMSQLLMLYLNYPDLIEKGR